ncbi:MAG: VanZ family protein [Leptospira sp.]|nr:VanZ family protein [Leptospira sp.]
MELKKGYPFLPLVDSLFGECLLSTWQYFNKSEESLKSLLLALYSGNEISEVGYTCTKNTEKEILHSKAPDEIRRYLETREYSNVAKALSSIALGTYMEVTHPSLDVVFELLEWILSGFDDIVLLNVLKEFLDGNEIIDEKFITHLKGEYSAKF